MEDLLKDVELIGAINYANWGIGLVLLKRDETVVR